MSRRPLNLIIPCFALIVTGCLLADTRTAIADVVTLYDGTQQAEKPQNYTPQHLLFFSPDVLDSYDPTRQATRLNTSNDPTDVGGYFNYNPIFNTPVNSDFPTLDRALGYTLRFTVEIAAESHINDLRSGFSVILISNDVGSGVLSSVEIGIQHDRVFSQPGGDNPFSGVPDEQASFAPIGEGMIDYELSVLNDSYEFWGGGDLLLSGNLKDYTSFTGFPDPYGYSNFVFFGDDTQSASGDIYFQKASIEVNSVPEASGWPVLLLVAAVSGWGYWRRRAKHSVR